LYFWFSIGEAEERERGKKNLKLFLLNTKAVDCENLIPQIIKNV
jgi:hypothetical protein